MRDLRTITVAELIEALQEQDPNAQVIFAADYGDRGRTEQALPLRGDCEEVQVRETAYSTSGWAIIDMTDDDEFDVAEGKTFVVIR